MTTTPKTVALTGATGFVGGALAARLTARGWRVRALVRSRSRRPPLAARPVEGDLADRGSLERLVAGSGVVVHCAGAVRGARREDFETANVAGVARLAEICAGRQPPPRFLLVSSLAAREPHLSFYAESKARGEEALASRSGEMPWTILRPPAVYGPGDREMLPLFRWMARGVAPLLGESNQRLSLIYVEDLVDAMARWMRQSVPGGRRYELHDGFAGGYTWRRIIETVARLRGGAVLPVRLPLPLVRAAAALNLRWCGISGRAPMLTPGKVRELTHPDWTADNTAIGRETGWTPRVGLEEGLRRTLGRLAARGRPQGPGDKGP